MSNLPTIGQPGKKPNEAVIMAEKIERVLIKGDLGELNPAERMDYCKRLCDVTGLDIMLQPFEYITFKGKTILYARKAAAEQLRRINSISVKIIERKLEAGVFMVAARASVAEGREDESLGAVSVDGLKGEDLANAMMKAETKAKRRVTLSISGLGMLDESEVEDLSEPKETRASVVEAPVKKFWYYSVAALPEEQKQGAYEFLDSIGALLDPETDLWVSTKDIPEARHLEVPAPMRMKDGDDLPESMGGKAQPTKALPTPSNSQAVSMARARINALQGKSA